MFDWIKNVFGGEKDRAKIRVYTDKQGKHRVQILDTRPPDKMVKHTLLVTSARSFKNAEEARNVARYVAKGGYISDEIGISWHE